MAEVWKQSPSVEGYEVSSLGRIRVKPYHKEMPYGGFKVVGGHEWKGTIARDASRPRYVTRFRGKTYKVHRLVCEAFHGPPPFAKTPMSCIGTETRSTTERKISGGRRGPRSSRRTGRMLWR